MFKKKIIGREGDDSWIHGYIPWQTNHYFTIIFRWTGSNTNPNNNDGQGQAGTDRSNVVLLQSQKYPEGTPGKAVATDLKFGHFGQNYPAHLNVVNLLGLSRGNLTHLALNGPG